MLEILRFVEKGFRPVDHSVNHVTVTLSIFLTQNSAEKVT